MIGVYFHFRVHRPLTPPYMRFRIRGSYFGCHSRYDPIKVAYPAERSLLLSIALVKIRLSAIRQ